MRLIVQMVAIVAVLLGIGGAVFYEFLSWRASAGSSTPATGLRREMLWIEKGDARHIFHVEIADTDTTRQVGLMFRDTLADDAGMLFVYPKVKDVTMWMENTYVSLDMLFLDPDGTIHAIAADAEPLSRAYISSHGPVRAVLELKAGTAARLKLAAGMRVRAPALGNATGG